MKHLKCVREMLQLDVLTRLLISILQHTFLKPRIACISQSFAAAGCTGTSPARRQQTEEPVENISMLRRRCSWVICFMGNQWTEEQSAVRICFLVTIDAQLHAADPVWIWGHYDFRWQRAEEIEQCARHLSQGKAWAGLVSFLYHSSWEVLWTGFQNCNII